MVICKAYIYDIGNAWCNTIVNKYVRVNIVYIHNVASY